MKKFIIEKRHNGCDIKNMFVPTSDGKPKKLCCMFCLKRYQKLERHLRDAHKDELAVKKFAACPPSKSLSHVLLTPLLHSESNFDFALTHRKNCLILH